MVDTAAEGRPHKPLRLGFIGGGENSAVGYTHYLAARMDGRFSVDAGCFSRNGAINSSSAARYGLDPSRCYKTIEDLLEQEAGCLDALCILTPTPDHCSTVKKSLRAGFNVICEKALATSVDEGIEIQEAIDQSNNSLFVTYNYAGYPMVREAFAQICAGNIGDLQQILCEMPQESFARASATPQNWRRQDYDLPCVSLDLGVHVHHMVDYLCLGRRHTRISSRQKSFGKIPNVIDTVHVLADYEDEILVSLMWGKASLGYSNGLRFRIFGSQGSLEWSQLNPDQLIMSDDKGLKRIVERGQPNLYEANRRRYNRFKAGHPTGFVEAFANIYSDFHYQLCDGPVRPGPDFSAEVAVRGLTMISEIHS